MSVSLSQQAFPQLVEAEFLYFFLGEETFNADRVNRIVTMADLKEKASELFHRDLNKSYFDLFNDFFTSVIPGFNLDHPVAQNIGSISKQEGAFKFWSTGIYYDAESGLFIAIGGFDKDKNLEPFRISLEFDETFNTYRIKNLPVSITQGWKIETFDLPNNEVSHRVFFNFTNPTAKANRNFDVWVRMVKLENDPANKKVCDLIMSTVYDQSLDLIECVDKYPSGGKLFAKSNFLLDPYYEQKLIKKFAFPVYRVDLKVKNKEDGSSFEQFEVYVDLSEYPAVPAIAVDMSKKSDGLSVPLNQITMIQFNKSKGSVLLEKYTTALSNQAMIDSGLSSATPEMFFLPTPEKPWFIEFANPPKKSGNTPQFNVWTRFVPPNVKLLLKAVKSPAFYRSDKLAQELIENARTTVDVKAVSASPSNVSSTATESASKATVNTVAVEVPSVEDDDF